MNDDQARRFGGLDRLWGVGTVSSLLELNVVVVGVGGVGSWAVEALARSGVGKITLIDMDHVSPSNINRQLQATDQAMGQAKVIALKERIAQFHPACDVQTIEDFVTPENWPDILPSGVDAIIDACDQMDAKLVMCDWSMQRSIPFITVGAAGGKQEAHRVEIMDLMGVTHDPLLGKLRRLLKQKVLLESTKQSKIMCVFSKESVKQPDANCNIESPHGSLNCNGYGSLISVTATFGMCAAGWILNQLSAKNKPTKNSL
ncbi:MAG: tRNA threonylcarbamoyladenosine dehydratase [Betaproteobacteria bacterium]|nr:tRNA threonylcarbamoyladenosine dehydratase [Betaproteobacteria bacterium]